MADTANLKFGIIDEGQVRAEITHNENMSLLDAVVFAKATAIQSTPPGSPVDGNVYIVGASPTGAWSGKADNIARYYQGWSFTAPKEGMLVFLLSDTVFWVYRNAAWRRTSPVTDLSNVGASYSQSEINTIVSRFNSLLAELRSVGQLKS